MKIRAGQYDVLMSGTVLSFDEEPTSFVVAENPDMVVKVVIKSSGKKEPSPAIETEVEGLTVTFKFVDPDAIAFGTATPVDLGTLGGRTLYANLRISAFGETTMKSYEITYTFYLGDQE